MNTQFMHGLRASCASPQLLPPLLRCGTYSASFLLVECTVTCSMRQAAAVSFGRSDCSGTWRKRDESPLVRGNVLLLRYRCFRILFGMSIGFRRTRESFILVCDCTLARIVDISRLSHVSPPLAQAVVFRFICERLI